MQNCPKVATRICLEIFYLLKKPFLARVARARPGSAVAEVTSFFLKCKPTSFSKQRYGFDGTDRDHGVHYLPRGPGRVAGGLLGKSRMLPPHHATHGACYLVQCQLKIDAKFKE